MCTQEILSGRLRLDPKELRHRQFLPAVCSAGEREGMGGTFEIIRSTSSECLETLLPLMKEVDSSRIVEGRDW